MPRLRLVQSGIQRTHADNSPQMVKVRLPVTPAILHQLKVHWIPLNNDGDIIMLWAAATLCFFGFFRAGEITLPTLKSYDHKRHLSWGDIAINCAKNPQTLKVHLKKSKTDQLGKGVDVYIGKTGCPLCPLTAIIHYISLQGTDPGPFFIFKDSLPLTKPAFINKVRQALQAIGLSQENFAGHSFRIGAATSAAPAGIEDSVIRKMGRWSSSAFLAYIRTPREQLAEFSKTLAHPR